MNYTWKRTPSSIKEGDVVSITSPRWEKRKWWQFWKPKWTEHPAETRVYRAGRGIEADRAGLAQWADDQRNVFACDSDTLPAGEDREDGLRAEQG